MIEPSVLLSAFRRLELRAAEAEVPSRALLVESLDHTRAFFAAVDSLGTWSLVVRARGLPRPIPALRLSVLSADYGVTYELQEGVVAESVHVCVIRCVAIDTEVRTVFANVCTALLDRFTAEPDVAEVEAEVSRWVSLFWRLQMPPRATSIGLIGELTLLDSTDRLADWVRAWHLDPADNLDFAFAKPVTSVEVKATAGQQRVHDISIHQAQPLIEKGHVFASVIVELRETGDRVGDVVAELGDRLVGRPEAELFWRALASVCGSSMNEFLDVRYMRESARQSLQFYSPDTIPQPVIQRPLPAGVSGVRFRSDFSSVAPVDRALVLAAPAAATMPQTN